MICLKCGAELAEGSFYCESCGVRVEPDATCNTRPARMKPDACPRCGKAVQADDLYCGFCGESLAGAEEAELTPGPEEEKTETALEPKPEIEGAEPAPEAGPEKEEAEPALGPEPEKEEAESALEPESEKEKTESAPISEPEKEETEPKPAPEPAEAEEMPEPAESETEMKPASVPEPETKAESESAADTAETEYAREDEAAEFELEEGTETSAVMEKVTGRLSHFRYLAPVAAGLVFLLVLTAFLRLFTGDKTEEARQSKVIYYHEDALYLADLAAKDSPAEITDSCLDTGVPPYEGLIGEDRISGDGNWLFWREEFDGETFDLYRMSLTGDPVKEKLAVNVASFEVLADQSVLFERGDSLYFCDGGEPVRLGRNVLFWQADREGGRVCWMEKDGENGNICYFQNVRDGSEKLELDKNVTEFYASDSLNRFMSLKGGVLYLLDASGEKERIAQNVVSVESCDLDKDKIYYMTENPVRLAYTDVIRDDKGVMTEEDWLFVSDLGQFEVPYRKLRYHWPKGDSEVSDRCFSDGQNGDPCVSEAGVYCFFTEGPRVEELKADWSEFKSRLDSDDFGALLLNELDRKGQFSGLRLAAEGRVIYEYENASLPGGQDDVCYDGQGQKLYLYLTADKEEPGALYEVPLTGGSAGDPEIVDDGIDAIQNMIAADEGVYYIRDPGAYGGDLYLNGQEIAYDVSGVWMMDGQLAYIYDYDRNNAGDSEFSVALYKNGEKTLAGKSVMCADCASDGTVVMLADFDPLKGEGRLLYFDGKDTRVLAEQATGFVPRNESAQIR